MGRDYLKKMMIVGTVFVIGISIIIVLDSASYAQSSKKMKGLHFQVPEDWPIEERGGIVGPIPTEEYIAIKFKATEEQSQVIKDKFTDRMNELQLNLKRMEVDFLIEIKKVQLQGGTSVETNEGLSELISGLDLFESELGRLDRKITNKVHEMKAQSEETARKMNSVEKKIKDLQALIYKLDEEIDYIFEKQKSSY